MGELALKRDIKRSVVSVRTGKSFTLYPTLKPWEIPMSVCYKVGRNHFVELVIWDIGSLDVEHGVYTASFTDGVFIRKLRL